MYGLCIAAGILVAAFFAKLILKNENKSFDDFIIYSTVLFGLGIAGAKLFYIFLIFPIAEIPEQLFYLVSSKEKSSAGFVFYGGLIFAMPGFFIARAITKKPVRDFLPVFACILPVIHAFGRIGCFCAGCCYGCPYEGVCAIHYHNPISQVQPDIGIFPVQLLEAALLFILSALLIISRFRMKASQNADYFSILSYLIFYSIIRFFLEFLRGDGERGSILIFSTSQFISLMIVFLCLGFIIFKIIKKGIIAR